MSIDDVRDHVARIEGVTILPPSEGLQSFALALLPGQTTRIDTYDNGVLSAHDADGTPNPALRAFLTMRLTREGVDLEDVTAPFAPRPPRFRKPEARAYHALSRFFCREEMDGMWEALVPDPDKLSATDRALVAAMVPEQAERLGVEPTGEVVRMSSMRDILEPVLKRLWPQWEGWQNTTPREHSMDEYVFDVNGDIFWDVVTGRPVAKGAINGTIPKHHWYSYIPPGASEREFIPPLAYMPHRENGHVVDGVVWVPGESLFVRDCIFTLAGRTHQLGARLLNTYRPAPDIEHDAPDAGPWLDLMRRMIPDDDVRERLLDVMAYTVQFPEHHHRGIVALVGAQGVGKDTILSAWVNAVGHWNTRPVSPSELVGRFNSWIESKLIMINENKLDLREGGAHSVYTTLKSLSEIPPAGMALDEKNMKARTVPKTATPVITSNEIASLHVAEDDRRYLLILITLEAGWHLKEGMPDYFEKLYHWLKRERGYAAVAKYLAERDISDYDPSTPFPMTKGKQIAAAATGEHDTILSKFLAEELGDPGVFFLAEVLNDKVSSEMHNTLRFGAKLMARLEKLGYRLVPVPDGETRWRFRARPSWAPRSASWEERLSRQAYVHRNFEGDAVAALLRRGEQWQHPNLHGRVRGQVPDKYMAALDPEQEWNTAKYEESERVRAEMERRAETSVLTP